MASFAFLPCALRVSAGLRRRAVAGLSLGFAAPPLRPPPCALRVSAGLRRSASPLCRFALRLVPCALALGFAAVLSPGSAASVFGSGCRYASSLENSSKEISFLSSVTTSFSAVISLRSAAWLTNWSACSGFFSISSA